MFGIQTAISQLLPQMKMKEDIEEEDVDNDVENEENENENEENEEDENEEDEQNYPGKYNDIF